MSKETGALLIATGVLLAILVVLFLHRRVIVSSAGATAGAAGTNRRRLLLDLVVGKDHRVSTSKSVVLVWTLAIVWGLVALLAAKLLGDGDGWEKLDDTFREEYLIVLGGPYAAAIFAKWRAVVQEQTTGRLPGSPDGVQARQLVADDDGEGSVVDLQYVLFNLVAVAAFVGQLIADPDEGFPELPDILWALALASVTGYTANKLVRGARPTLTSAVPTASDAASTGVVLTVYGTNLIIPALGTAGTSLPPVAAIDGAPATVETFDQIAGADRLTVAVPAGKTGTVMVSVVRADGIPAVGPAGADGVSVTLG